MTVNHLFQEVLYTLVRDLSITPFRKDCSNPQGNFALAKLTLSLGENKISARARDSEGNISKTTEMIVVVYNEPPAAPTGLATAVQDYQVQLTWNPNTESDVSGYNLYRKGERINAPVAINPEAVTTSASFSGNGVRLRYFAFAALDHILFQPIIMIKCPGK